MTINQYDRERLKRTLNDIWMNTNKMLPDLVKQTTYWALISATKATEPGTKSRVSKLQQKYKIRPVVTVKQGLFYGNTRIYMKEDGSTFGSKKSKMIPKSSREKHGLKLIKKGYKKWDKKRKGFVVAPYFKEKRDKSDKQLQIPHAGAAKYGWLGGVKKIGYDKGGWDVDRLDSEIKRKSNVVTKRNAIDEVSISVDNIIDYITKTSPSSAKVGLFRATNKMRGIYKKALNKAISKGNVA